MKKISIATHNGTFHSDEVTAIALLKVFMGVDITVSRLTHQSTKFDDFDFVIDIGREFDGDTRFDHHQYEGGLSSAGLIWVYLENVVGVDARMFPKISELVNIVDENDVGIRKSKPYEYPAILSLYNHNEPYQEIQRVKFFEAIDFAVKVISEMKLRQEEIFEAYPIVLKSINENELDRLLLLLEPTKHWMHFVNAETYPKYEYVYWYEAEAGDWHAQVVPNSPNDFSFGAKPFPPNDEMEFVHANGFFCVAKTQELMLKYLLNILRRK